MARCKCVRVKVSPFTSCDNHATIWILTQNSRVAPKTSQCSSSLYSVMKSRHMPAGASNPADKPSKWGSVITTVCQDLIRGEKEILRQSAGLRHCRWQRDNHPDPPFKQRKTAINEESHHRDVTVMQLCMTILYILVKEVLTRVWIFNSFSITIIIFPGCFLF